MSAEGYGHTFALKGGAPVNCLRCGALVFDTTRHDGFHTYIDRISESVAAAFPDRNNP